MILALAAILMHPTGIGDEAWEHLRAQIELAPQAVATFIERRTGCNHWDGEAGSSYSEREEQVQSERRKLRCDHIQSDAHRLEHRYRGRPEILRLLHDTADLDPW
jgi:hypothetical protein